MASPAVVDFAKILAPISADKPTGVDLRADKSATSLYYEIRGARTTARDAEKMVFRGESPPQLPDWKGVQRLCEKALTEQTKDLEITVYLIEALVRVHQFQGLRDGFQLASELVDRFWDKLFPSPDEDGESTRTKPLDSLNNAEATLIVPIGRVPIATSFPYADYKEGVRLKQSTDAKVRQKGDEVLEGFKKVKEATPAEFFITLVEDLSACIKEFAKFSESLKKKCGDNGPPTSAIRTALTEYLELAKTLAPAPAKEQSAEAEKAESAKSSPATPNKPEAIVPGVIRSRKQALETLQKVAAYFREAEPHSPVSYNVEQAIRWANLPLPALLTELIAEEAPRKNVFKQVGIVPQPPNPPR
jgi:type VI secretion system protein ImpA